MRHTDIEWKVMVLNISQFELPPVYKRQGKECYLDPIRNKLIYITPEETVRQRMIGYLLEELKVPKEMISVEEHLSHYHISSNRRADIIVHAVKEETRYPILVVECKAPEVYLDEKAHNQVFDYCDALGANYALISNGTEVFNYRYSEEENEYELLTNMPTYEKMLSDEYQLLEIEKVPERIPFDKIEDYLVENFKSYPEKYYGEDISKSTPMNLAKVAFNLQEAFLDIKHQIPEGDYGSFTLIQDYGIRWLTYGNAGGGKFSSPYRSFLIDYKGNTEFVSFSFSTYGRTEKESAIKTCMCVAHDNEMETHHALQLSFEDNVKVINGKVIFYHSGRIAIGNKGSGKIDELREFIDGSYPQIIDGNRFNLGTLENDHLWEIDQPDVIKLIVNCITYALIRDEYREYVKQR